MRPGVLLLLCCAACSHSESFPDANYGAIGPLVPGAEAQLTYNSVGNASWTPDGQGIVIGLMGCIGLMPAQGGSAIWQGCDTRAGLLDSTHHIDGYSVGYGGIVLFSVSTRARKWDELFSPADFPAFAHGDLWLSDTAHFTAAHNVLRLYNDTVAPLVAGPSGFVRVTSVQWLNDREFIALGAGVTFNGLFGPAQLVRGIITSAGVSLTAVPGDAPATTRAVTNGGATLVVITGTLTLGAFPLVGGTVASFATVPDAPSRRIVDVTCQATRCVILTQEAGGSNGTTSTFWWVPSSGGVAQPGKSFPHELSSGAISPVSGDALTIESGRPFLLTGVVP